MKTVYFLRHGECESNVKGAAYLGMDAKLTDKGAEDAKKIIPKLRDIEFDTVISSSASRAIKTAEIVTSDRGLAVEVTDMFVEREHPSELLGVTHEDELFGQIKSKVKEAFRREGKYADEESFSELVSRAVEFKKYLEDLEGNTILVVGHGKFTKFFLSYLCFGESFDAETFIHLDEFMGSRNLGLSEATYDDTSNRWRLRQWNAELISGDKLEIRPARFDNSGEYTVFDAIRDNEGKGLKVKDLQDLLDDID